VPLDRSGAVAGTTPVRFEYYPRAETNRPALSTIVAAEGGPGYSTTDSRDYYLDLFRPLMSRRALLLVDQRGTGMSNPFNCSEAESYDGNWVSNAEACGAQLGDRSDLYTTANAAADLAAVLDELDVDSIDLYGDSYGSFFAQTFAVRYPTSVRTLVLDGTYPIEGLDPFYRTTARRLPENLDLICQRSAPTCPTQPGRMDRLVRRVVNQLRSSPVWTTAPDANGDEISVTLTPRRVLDVLLSTDATPGWLREAPAALDAQLAGNPRPLARLVAEAGIDVADGGGRAVDARRASSLRGYSEGAYLAYSCTDYPQLWDVRAPFVTREAQLASTVAGVPAQTFAPWSNPEWADSEFFVYDYCLHWPAPRTPEPPFPAGGSYPTVPTLVLNGELDLRTDVYQAREVAQNFPRSTYVEVPNIGHVTALYDADACASSIVRHFVQAGDTGGTACLGQIPEHRLVKHFAENAAQAPQATVAPGPDYSTAADRRAARVAVETVADVIDRWYAIPGETGVGLYGGKFRMTSSDTDPFVSRVWTLKLTRLKWTRDIQVSGTGTVPRGAGTANVTVDIEGAATESGKLAITWETRARNADARITGTIGGRSVDLLSPAPSYY
jgi:pimeloyl-ACP methyl ester carboxylesterase